MPKFLADLNIGDGINLLLGTGAGTKIGTSTSSKLGFYNATPVIQALATADLKDAFCALGFMVNSGASPLNLDGGTLTAGSITANEGTSTFSNSGNLALLLDDGPLKITAPSSTDSLLTIYDTDATRTVVNLGTYGCTISYGGDTANITTALTIENFNAATSPVPVQRSPSLKLSGRAWNTTSLASHTSDWYIDSNPSSANPITGSLVFSHATNGPTATAAVTFTDAGGITATGAISGTSGSFSTTLAVTTTSTFTGMTTHNGGITLTNDASAANTIVAGTTNGLKIGTATSQKLGFFNATPIIQAVSTSDLKDAFCALGFMVNSGASPLNLDGGTLTAGSVVVTGNNGGSVQILPFATHTSWIDMPAIAGFASGIGSGGAGVNPWVAYAGSGGNWFSNAVAGDICYRNTAGNLRFGATGGSSQMHISSTAINLATTGNLGFYNVTAVDRQSATTDLKDALTNYGLLQGTSASPLNLDGGAFTAGTISGTTGTFSSSISATSATFNGNITLTGSGGENRTINFGANLGASALTLYDGGSNGTRWGWGLNAGEMQFYGTASGSNHFSWNAGGDLQGVGTNEKMRLVIATGALLINTTSDDGVNKLQVNGGITATSISNNISTQKIVTSYGKTAAGTALTTGQSSTAQSELNFIAGTNVTLTVNNNTANSRVDVTIAASGGSPGGSNTQVQFNDSGVFGGDADFTWDKTNNALYVAGAYTGVLLKSVDQATVGSGTGTTAPDLIIRSGHGGDVSNTVGTAGNAGDLYILGGEGGSMNTGATGPQQGEGGDVIIRGGLGGGVNETANSNGTYLTTEGSVIIEYSQPGKKAIEVTQDIGRLWTFYGGVSIDFNHRVLVGGGGIASIDWLGRTLIDGVAVTSLTWGADGVRVAKSISSGVVTLTDAATVTISPKLGNHFRLVTTSGIGATRAIGAPGISYDGHKITFEFVQDATGSRAVTLTTGSVGAFIYGTDITSITLTTTANKRDIMGAIYSDTLQRWMVVSFIKGF